MARRPPLPPMVAAVALSLGMSSVARPARADDGAAAQILWEEGRALAKEGDFEAACPKFLESNKLDPQLGTLLNLADCYAQAGKVASAWARFVEAEEMAKARKDRREAEAKRRAAELEPKLIRLELLVEDPAPGMTIRRDDEEVAEALWGTEVPVDPGSYTLVAEAPGYLPWEKEWELTEEGATFQVKVPALEPAPENAPAEQEQEKADTPAPSGDDGLRTGLFVSGVVTGGLGVVGLGVGTAFLVIAKGKDDESLDFCRPDDPTLCSQQGVDLRDEALTAQTIGIVGMVAGGVLGATGTALIVSSLYLEEGEAPDVALLPWAGPRGAGLVGQLSF